MYLYPSDGGLM